MIGRGLFLASVVAGAVMFGACGSDDGGTAKPGNGGTGGGKADAANDSPSDTSLDQGSSCSNGQKDGTETDVDCGGSCDDCATDKGCAQPEDCADGICTGGKCAAASCSDGVANGDESGVDCGGACPKKYHGFGCVTGTNGSQACSSFPNDAGTPVIEDGGEEKFQVAISWNATGGNGKVNYVLVSEPNGASFNSQGIAGGSPLNTCVTAPVTETFLLPLGDNYTYKIWWADCINPNACAGCGSDVVIAEGGPFGIAEDLCI